MVYEQFHRLDLNQHVNQPVKGNIPNSSPELAENEPGLFSLAVVCRDAEGSAVESPGRRYA